MWLTIQIAAGIILAYVIIRHGAAVWKYSLGLVMVGAIFAAIILVGSFASQAVEGYGGLGEIATKGLHILGVMIAIGIYVTGLFGEGYAIRVIFNRVFHRQWSPSETTQFFAGAGNFMFTGLALQGFDLTENGPIMGPIDAYGRAHGWADGLTVAAWLVVSLWIIPLGLWLDRRQPVAAKPDEVE